MEALATTNNMDSGENMTDLASWQRERSIDELRNFIESHHSVVANEPLEDF